MLRKILSASIIINLGLLLGRLLGFVREIIIAEGYGASWKADVTITILTLPDILINVLVGGALTAALVPNFTADKANAGRLAYQSSLLIFVLFLGLSGLLAFQSDKLVSLLAPGYSGQTEQVARAGVAWVVMLLPLFVLTGVTTALLHSREKFAIPSLGTFFFNAVLIVGLLFVTRQDEFNILFIVFAVLMAGAARYLSQVIAVRPGFEPLGMLRPWLVSRDLLRRYWQAMLSGGILFVYPVAARAYASLAGEGGVALFNYSMRLIELPLLLCVSFLGVVLMPRLSEAYQNDKARFTAVLAYGLQAVFVLGVVAVATLFVGRHSYIAIVYGRGLQPEAIAEVTQLVAVGLLCVLFQGAVTFMTAAFNAAQRTQVPLLLNLLGGFLLFLFLQANAGASLLEIMIALTSTYGVLALVYSVVITMKFFAPGQIISQRLVLFAGGVLAVNAVVGLAHQFALGSVEGMLLPLGITVMAGVIALAGSALCHPDLYARLSRKYL